MTERLADLSAHIDGIRQLGTVVNAMRGVAAARAQQARRCLDAVDSYAATIAFAIGRALSLSPFAPRGRDEKAKRPALIIFCAEQGFAGAFSERVFEAVGPDLVTSELFLIGTRGAAVGAERGVVAGWTGAMPSHPDNIPKLADQAAEALYARIAKGKIDRLDAVFSHRKLGHATMIERRRLFPFDAAALPHASLADVPLLNLTPQVLLADLISDYLHAQLCHAALHAFAAENEARMEAMAAARTQVERKLSSLQARLRFVRQEEITAEIIELAVGETASRKNGQRRRRLSSRTLLISPMNSG